MCHAINVPQHWTFVCNLQNVGPYFGGGAENKYGLYICETGNNYGIWSPTNVAIYVSYLRLFYFSVYSYKIKYNIMSIYVWKC